MENLRKTRLCNSFKRGEKCYYKNCSYAHRYDEIIFKNCLNGKECKKIVYENNEYLNLYSCPCEFLHPDETKENWKKRQTYKVVKFPSFS